MYYLYKIVNTTSGREYYGMTGNMRLRWNSHMWAYKIKKTPLYDAMKSYGIECFEMVLIEEFEDKQECCMAEIGIIAAHPESYNLHPGGNGGYVVPEYKKEEWKSKLSIARQGGRPALGMQHTDENKELFAKLSREYWNSQDTYNAECILKYSFKDAKRIFGISKTHYYRLKRALSNDQC